MPMEYNRALTAIAMAKADAWKMRTYMEKRMRALRAEADEIEESLKTSTKEVDEWHDAIRREYDEERLAPQAEPSPTQG